LLDIAVLLVELNGRELALHFVRFQGSTSWRAADVSCPAGVCACSIPTAKKAKVAARVLVFMVLFLVEREWGVTFTPVPGIANIALQ
jgi:hypothetical protein